MRRIAGAMLLVCAAASAHLNAQTAFDTSGNSRLSGTYYFRHVLYGISTNYDSSGLAGDVTEAIAVYGNISFDGNGNYTITGGQVADSANTNSSGTVIVDPLSCYNAGTNCTSGSAVLGTYSVSSSGYGFISNPIISGDLIVGLVGSNGVFVASSTETTYAYSDLLIAAPLSGAAPNNSTFSGTYSVAAYIPGGAPGYSADAFFQIAPDGNGNLGTVNISGYYGNGATTPITQSSSNVKYNFQNGAAIVTFPTSSSANFFSGQEFFYFSPDGNFFFGGSPTNLFDMVVGVRGTGTQNFNGLYYEGGLDQVYTTSSSGYINFDSYYGSFNATPSGTIVAHDRLSSVFNNAVIGSTYADSFTPPVSGPYIDTPSNFQYAVGGNGTVRVGAGIYPYLGLTVAVQAPTFTPSGSVYLNPTGVVNAASFSPFTAGITNGEFISLFGNNLAGSTVVSNSIPYPPTLGNVQVLINGTAAPLYFVTPGQLAAITPYGTAGPYASVQVINNGVASNTVTVPVNTTVPGVYTIPSGGVGYAAAVHLSGQIVTATNPASPGETIEVFLTGLGTVSPTVADGAAAPAGQLSVTTNSITASIGGTGATVAFAGLAPTLAGLYQINLTIPSSVSSGNQVLAISGPDSYAAQAQLPIGSVSTMSRTADAPAARRAAVNALTAQGASRLKARSVQSGRKALCTPFSKAGCASGL